MQGTEAHGVAPGPIALALASAGERGGIHGHQHWRRVGEMGIDLAHEEGVSRHVALLFAILHDCRRENDGHDPGHGPRAAALAHDLGHQPLGITPVWEYDPTPPCCRRQPGGSPGASPRASPATANRPRGTNWRNLPGA